MGMIMDNTHIFKGMTKKERIWQVLSQFVDEKYDRSHFGSDKSFEEQDEYEKLDYATENIWKLITTNYGEAEAPLID
jgi:thioredoxin-like negative regulator of GroEL